MSRYTISLFVSACAALFLGFGPIPHNLITAWFHASGFYFVLFSFILWFVALLTPLPKNFSAHLKTHLPAFALSCILIYCILIVSPYQFRILYDESNLLGVSQAMYENASFYIPIQALFHNDQMSLIDYEWGIRPLIFPFFIFLFHLILGYDAANVFYLNTIIGLLTLFCFYLLLQRFFSKTLAYVGMGLLAAYPIFGLWTTSGGFEITNLCMVILAFYFLHRLLNNGTSSDATKLVFTLLLLAQVRYETAILLIVFIPALVIHSFKNPYAKPHAITAIAPLLLLPVAWQRTLYSSDQAFMVAEGQSMFGLNHFMTNIGHALDFFLGTNMYYGTIPYLLIPTLVGLVWGIIHFIQNRNTMPIHISGLVIVGLASLTLLSITIFGYILGNLTRPFSIRLGIVFLPFLITAIIYLCHIGLKKLPKLVFPIGLVTLLTFIWMLPITSQNKYAEQLSIYQINRAYLSFLQDTKPSPETLMISQHARLFIPHRQSAITFEYANQNWPKISNHINTGLIHKILVFQLLDPNTHHPHPQNQLSINLSLEPLVETVVGDHILRASTVVLNQ